MADATDDIDKLYEFGEHLNDANDKSQVSTLFNFIVIFSFFSLFFLAVRVSGRLRLSILWFYLVWLLKQHKQDYEGIIAAANGSVKAKQLAAQLIPKFFKFFPQLAEQALDQHLNLIEDQELGVSIRSIHACLF